MKRVLYPLAVCAVSLVATNFSLTGTVAANERRQLDSHEHGVTILNIAVENDVMVLELEGPGMNFVGFEHPPETPEQKTAVSEAVQFLENGTQLFQISAAAECKQVEAVSQHVMETEDAETDDHHSDHHDDPADDSDGHNDDHAKEALHSEFIGRYRYECNRPGKLTELRLDLFERFPLTTEVETSYVGPDFQTFERLTVDNPVLQINPR